MALAVGDWVGVKLGLCVGVLEGVGLEVPVGIDVTAKDGAMTGDGVNCGAQALSRHGIKRTIGILFIGVDHPTAQR